MNETLREFVKSFSKFTCTCDLRTAQWNAQDRCSFCGGQAWAK